MKQSNIIFCNGLVGKPQQWEGHLESLDSLLQSVLNHSQANIQFNVDWRPFGMTVDAAMREVYRHYGNRLKSIVTYWDPAHNATEIKGLCDCLAAMDCSLLLRLNMRSAESVRMLFELLASNSFAKTTPVLNVDACSAATIRDILQEANQRVRFQVSHETPLTHLELFDRSLIGTVQIAIGSANAIDECGNVRLDDGMVVRGGYSLPQFLSDYWNDHSMKVVIMGPTLPSWTERDNYQRLNKGYSFLSSHGESRSEQRSTRDCYQESWA